MGDMKRIPWLALGLVAGLIAAMFVEPTQYTATTWATQPWRYYALIWCPIIGVLGGALLDVVTAVLRRAHRTARNRRDKEISRLDTHCRVAAGFALANYSLVP